MDGDGVILNEDDCTSAHNTYLRRKRAKQDWERARDDWQRAQEEAEDLPSGEAKELLAEARQEYDWAREQYTSALYGGREAQNATPRKDAATWWVGSGGDVRRADPLGR